MSLSQWADMFEKDYRTYGKFVGRCTHTSQSEIVQTVLNV